MIPKKIKKRRGKGQRARGKRETRGAKGKARFEEKNRSPHTLVRAKG